MEASAAKGSGERAGAMFCREDDDDGGGDVICGGVEVMLVLKRSVMA